MQEVIESINIEDMIYEIRGVQVMLDSDLANLYHVETRVFNQSVKRNIKRYIAGRNTGRNINSGTGRYSSGNSIRITRFIEKFKRKFQIRCRF